MASGVIRRVWHFAAIGVVAWTVLVAGISAVAEENPWPARLAPVRAAINDLAATYGREYPAEAVNADFAAFETRAAAAPSAPENEAAFDALKRKALLANPLLTRQPVLYVTRAQYRPDHHSTETMFQTCEINTDSFVGGGAIKTLDLRDGGASKTLIEVPSGIVRDIEVRWDGARILFSMRRDKADDYHVYEMNADGSGLQQLTFGAGVSDIDPFYLPDGRIGLSSTREPKYCHCNRHVMANLFTMDADGANLHQIGHNTLFEGHGVAMPDGRILYDRWEYVDRHFGPSFGLWTVNPDGTNHALYYGNNAWSPGGIVDARIIPGTEQVIATFTSCHDRPWGAIALVDRRLGMDGTQPLLKTWPADLSPYLNVNETGGIDAFKQVEPKYEDPYPLSERYFLCSRAIEGETMGLFLLDMFGNELLVHQEGPGCYDPMPLASRPIPPGIPSRVRLARNEGTFYVHNVYAGSGMESVPRGTVKYLRIIEAPRKDFWTQQNWNIDATQAPAMNWNLTNSKRILGDVPVEEDGSAYFIVPSDTFVYFQALDADKMMIQSMRSGTMIQPGEMTGCYGCHEERRSAPVNHVRPKALDREPSRIEPWYGPPRPFNYLTEVQPVFDGNCVQCHDYGTTAGKKLNLAGDTGLVFNTSYTELRSKSPVRWSAEDPDGKKPLVKSVDDGPPQVLPPYAWGSHRSRLIDAMRDGHAGFAISRESFERVAAWLDMNGVYYGEYGTPFPDNPFGRSPMTEEELRKLSEVAGVEVGTQPSEMRASQISFTRPDRSPCLSAIPEEDPRRAEGLALIQAGVDRLAATPRTDMPGFHLTRDVEVRQAAKIRADQREEARVRDAIVQGEKVYKRGADPAFFDETGLPDIDGGFARIYKPGPNVFPGPDAKNLQAGQTYASWIPNDHTFIQGPDGLWHCFGITGPETPIVHEAEWMAFHLTSPDPSLAGSLMAWNEQPLVLPPSERPGERKELYAPFVVKREDRYYMFYGPSEMRLATSADLFHWTPEGPCFTQEGNARDPWITTLDGRYHMVYVAGNAVYLRTSDDLRHWSDPPVTVFTMPRKGEPESPMLIKRDNSFYLFWTLYDGENTAYDNRTFVYRSDRLDGFQGAEPIARLRAHAPELVQDNEGQWFISSAEWPYRGIGLARLTWR